MITYNSGNECTFVNKDSIKGISRDDLKEVYEALKGKINIPFDSFVDGNTDEINRIRISAINLYVIGLKLLYNSNKKARQKFRYNLGERFGLLRMNDRTNSALYVIERLEELEFLSPTRNIDFGQLEAYCLKEYTRAKKFYNIFKEQIEQKLREINGQDYDKYLCDLIECSREDYVNQKDPYAKRMKSGLDVSKAAYRFIKANIGFEKQDVRNRVNGEFGDLNNDVEVTRKLFQFFLDVSKLNDMGYGRISATNYNDLIAYAFSKDKFSELVNIEDKGIQAQIPIVFENIKRNPNFKDRFASVLGEDADTMSVGLMTKIYRAILEVNDLNSYKGKKIDVTEYMYLTPEQKQIVRKRAIFLLRIKFSGMSDSELEEYLSNYKNVKVLSPEDRKEFLSLARKIIVNSIDITANIIENEDLLYIVGSDLESKTITSVFNYITNAQVSRFLYRKMYGKYYDLNSIHNLVNSPVILIEYIKVQYGKRFIQSQLRENSLTPLDGKSIYSKLNEIWFTEKKGAIISETFDYLRNKYPNDDPAILYRKLSNYLDNYIKTRGNDYTIFDGLTPEKIDAAINSETDNMGFMFDVVKPDEDGQGSAKKALT